MTGPEREALRQKISEARRATTPEPRCPRTNRALSYAYRHLGCRCGTCVQHQSAERQRRKQGLLRGTACQKKEHGEQAWKKGRCKCERCRQAASAGRRRRYLAAKARALA